MNFTPVGRCAGRAAALLAAAFMASACQSPRPPANGAYRVVWSAFRARDNAPLVRVASPAFAPGGSVDVRTDSIRPADDVPAFPRFTARLATSTPPGAVQLVTRAYVKEATRTKKGKLKVKHRVIGGLLPTQPGQPEEFNGPGDPIRVEATLERVGTRR